MGRVLHAVHRRVFPAKSADGLSVADGDGTDAENQDSGIQETSCSRSRKSDGLSCLPGRRTEQSGRKTNPVWSGGGRNDLRKSSEKSARPVG